MTPKIRLGLLFYPHHEIETPPQKLVHAALAHARLADEGGFDSLWTGHHYLTDDQILQPIPLLARLAAEVSRIRLGAWFILPLGNPVDLAEQFATLDAISEGRLICGAVMGYRDVEFRSLGIPKEERAARLEEAVTVLKLLWTKDNVTYRGRRVHLEGISIYPKPVQKPYPPIWVGGNSLPAARRAARIGDAWAMSPYQTLSALIELRQAYDAALRDAGGNPHQVVRPLLRDIMIARRSDEAWTLAERFIGPFYKTYARWGKEQALGRPGEFSVPFRELARDRFIIGDPATFKEEIHRYQELLGIDTFIFQINRPGMPTEMVLDGVRILADAVLPHLS